MNSYVALAVITHQKTVEIKKAYQLLGCPSIDKTLATAQTLGGTAK